MFRLVLIVTALALAAPAVAQTATAGARPPVVLNMDEDIIEGVTFGPQDTVIRERPKPTHKSLIQIRKSFAPELLASVAKI